MHHAFTRWPLLTSRLAGEGVRVGSDPLFEGTRLMSGDSMDGVEDARVVELTVAEEAEQRVDEVPGCVRLHLGASLFVGERLVLERSFENPRRGSRPVHLE